jgi:hypothetical protein
MWRGNGASPAFFARCGDWKNRQRDADAKKRLRSLPAQWLADEPNWWLYLPLPVKESPRYAKGKISPMG